MREYGQVITVKFLNKKVPERVYFYHVVKRVLVGVNAYKQPECQDIQQCPIGGKHNVGITQ